MTVFVSNSELRSDTADVTAGAQLQLAQAADLVTPGVLVYRDSGRTLLNKLFKRTGPTNTELAIPRLRAWVGDAYGFAYASQAAANFAFKVRRHSDSADENSQTTITTDATGKAEWSYTIANNHTAFNHYKTALNTVDNGASPPMSIAAADVDAENPFSKAAFAGPYPAYPKHVAVVGNGFSAGKEPTVTVSSAFGVNSSAWPGITGTLAATVGGTYTSDAGRAIDNADGVPTSTGRRSKTLGSGSLSIKPWTAEYDEGDGIIVSATRGALRDVASRLISTATDLWFGRWGVFTGFPFNTTRVAAADMSDSGVNDMRLQGTYSYSPAFLSLVAPGDPSEEAVIIGFADTSAQRGTLTFTSASAYGFSSDTGNYGAIAQDINWIAVDPDLSILPSFTKQHMHLGDTVTIQAKMIRYLSNNSHADVTPDAGLHISIYKVATADSPMTLVAEADMVAITGSTTHFEYMFNPGSTSAAIAGYTVAVTGAKDGSRPPSSVTGNLFVVDKKNKHDITRHLSVGDSSS